MASSQGDVDYPDDYVHDDVKYLLGWNPEKLDVDMGPEASTRDFAMSSARLPPTSIPDPARTATNNRSRMNTGTRPASFYDKHLSDKLVLKHVKVLDTLVVDLAATVDKAIKDAYQKGIQLPVEQGMLWTRGHIKTQTTYTEADFLREDGVAEHYNNLTALPCLPVASTLALHPSFSEWASLLRWTKEVSLAKFAIADGALKLLKHSTRRNRAAWDFVDGDKKILLSELPARYPDIAIWEMKSLTVGDKKVMEEIWQMGLLSRTFQWKVCKKGFCEHREADLMRMVGTLAKAPGVDALSPPWLLSVADASGAGSLPGSQSTADAGTSQPRKSVYVESTQSSLGDGNPGASVRPSRTKRKHPSPIPWAHGDTVRPPLGDGEIKKKEKKEKKNQKKKDDASFQGKVEVREEVNAQSFLQQSWAQAVRTNSTILVLHSGNHEIIGIRHRKSQTLYISNVIEPHAASPAYGKIHVGLYIAALWDVMDRIQQDLQAEKENAPSDPPPDDGGEGEDKDEDEDDHRSKKRPRTTQPTPHLKSTTRGKRSGKSGAKSGGRTAGGMTDQDVLLTASSRDRLLVHLCYGIYLSPGPATFVRKGVELGEASVQEDNPSDSDNESEPLESMDVILYSELAPGSTGIVHIGEMEVEPFGPTVKVAVKLAFSREHKSALEREHRLYSHMNSKGVSGIPQSLGLFVSADCDDGAEAPYALVMTYAGVTLFGQKEDILPVVKESLISTLKSIHKAGVLHGDIRLANFCATPTGEAFIVDFSHAGKSTSKTERAHEIAELCHILGVELNTPRKKPVPENTVEDETGLRRSSRIKILKEKTQALMG